MTDPGTILKLDQARCEAMIRADIPTVTAMFADDMMWIHGDAHVDTKAGLLDDIRSGKIKYLVMGSTDETVRFYGGLAFLSAVTTAKVEIAGGHHDFENRSTIVWAQDGDDWKVVNWQLTSVPKAA